MSLDSFEFMLFLPLAFVLYWVMPSGAVKGRNVLLLALSYAFYGYADWRFCLLLLAMTVCTFVAGRWMYRLQEGGILQATQEDRDSISHGKVPPQLMVDGCHFTKEGYRIIAQLVKEKIDSFK